MRIVVLLLIFLAADVYCQKGEAVMNSVAMPKLVTSREGFVQSVSWIDETVEVVIPSEKAGATRRAKWAAKTVIYRTAGGEFPLSLVEDPDRSHVHVVLGQQSFYVIFADRLLACRLDAGPFRITPSIWSVQGSLREFAAALNAVHRSNSDEQLLEGAGPKAGKTLDLRKSGEAPPFFFTKDSSLSSQPETPTIKGIDVTDDVLKLDLESPGGRYQGTFWIDLNEAKLVRATVEGESPLIKLR